MSIVRRPRRADARRRAASRPAASADQRLQRLAAPSAEGGERGAGVVAQVLALLRPSGRRARPRAARARHGEDRCEAVAEHLLGVAQVADALPPAPTSSAPAGGPARARRAPRSPRRARRACAPAARSRSSGGRANHASALAAASPAARARAGGRGSTPACRSPRCETSPAAAGACSRRGARPRAAACGGTCGRPPRASAWPCASRAGSSACARARRCRGRAARPTSRAAARPAPRRAPAASPSASVSPRIRRSVARCPARGLRWRAPPSSALHGRPEIRGIRQAELVTLVALPVDGLLRAVSRA